MAFSLGDNRTETVGVNLCSEERTEHFLAECAVVLGSTLDYEHNLHALAQLAVPFLGDICFVDVADGAHIERVARLSKKYGTVVDYRDGVGVIRP